MIFEMRYASKNGFVCWAKARVNEATTRWIIIRKNETINSKAMKNFTENSWQPISISDLVAKTANLMIIAINFCFNLFKSRVS